MFRFSPLCRGCAFALALPLAVIAAAQSPDPPPSAPQPSDAPVVTMAPHPENKSWWLSGQANFITQGDLPFHSPYQGQNSFILTRPFHSRHSS